MNLDLFNLNQTYYSKTNIKQNNKESKLLNGRNNYSRYLSAFIFILEMKHKDAIGLNKKRLSYLLV